MPSTNGKRIDVQIDPILIANAEKERKTKEKEKLKKEDSKPISIVDIITDGGSKFDEKQIEEIIHQMGKPQKSTAAGVKKEKTTTSKKAKDEPVTYGSDGEQVVNSTKGSSDGGDGDVG